MKKFLASLTSAVFALALLSLLAVAIPKHTAQAATTKPLDLYIVMGQSNAAGYSKWEQIAAEDKKPVYSNGFEDVYYYGRADSNYQSQPKTNVKYGQGIANDRFGVEVGLADVIDTYSENEALIFKYAIGGTYLADNTTSWFSTEYGNWCSPSMTRSNPSISGVIYDDAMESLQQAVELYEGLGYTINLKGTFWMQGEAECDGTGPRNYQYDRCLTALINDLRDDYFEILGDERVKVAPFVIGKICPSFISWNNTTVAVQRGLQESVAAAMQNVLLLETSDYVIVNQQGQHMNGFDQYHFTGYDMLDMGKKLGEAIIVGNKPRVQVQVVGNGQADVSGVVLEGEPVTVTFTATKEHYYLSKLEYDGVDVTANMVGNTYTVDEDEGIHLLKATFVEEERYKITVTGDEFAKVSKSPLQADYYAGAKVRITITVDEGYELYGATYAGEEITVGEDGKVTVTIVAGENELVLDIDVAGSRKPGGDNGGNGGGEGGSSSGGGCSGVIGGGAATMAALAIGAVALIRARKKRD